MISPDARKYQLPHRDMFISCQFCDKKLVELKIDWWFGTTIDYDVYLKATEALGRMVYPPMCEDCHAIYERICREAWPLNETSQR